MKTIQSVQVGDAVCGPGWPLLWILGPCVIESHELTLRIAETLAELANTRLDELLPLLGHVILGVFAEVTERGGLLDLFRKFVNQLVFERVDLFLQLAFDLICHG